MKGHFKTKVHRKRYAEFPRLIPSHITTHRLKALEEKPYGGLHLPLTTPLSLLTILWRTARRWTRKSGQWTEVANIAENVTFAAACELKKDVAHLYKLRSSRKGIAPLRLAISRPKFFFVCVLHGCWPWAYSWWADKISVLCACCCLVGLGCVSRRWKFKSFRFLSHNCLQGFDVFDSLLFNYVAPLVLADLLGVDSETKEGQENITFWFYPPSFLDDSWWLSLPFKISGLPFWLLLSLLDGHLEEFCLDTLPTTSVAHELWWLLSLFMPLRQRPALRLQISGPPNTPPPQKH